VKLRTIVWRELFERRNQLTTSLLAIILGIAALVSIRNVTFYSEKAVAAELDALGTNILILPKSASIQDYYSADMHDDEIPEEYVATLTRSDLQGLDNLSPKLTVSVELKGKQFTLTGILPKSEFPAKAIWQGAGLFSRPVEGCGEVAQVPAAFRPPIKETLVRNRVVDDLGPSEILIGSDVADILHLRKDAEITVLDNTFKIVALLPQTGTVDDARLFAHLHTVQHLAGKGRVVNAIEVVGCCQEISQGIVQKINGLLPDARVVTIRQVVDTQINTNRMMSRLSFVFIGIIVLIGGASIANYMYANVYERRKEIGTMMALGACSNTILKLFMSKALWLGLVGGLSGYVIGTLLAVTFGPRLAGIPVLPMPFLVVWATAISVLIALLASYLPARSATKLDPCITLMEG